MNDKNYMINKPLVTLIIPIFNGAEFIPQLIGMIKEQTYEKLDIIVIDDGSTDETLRLCREYCKDDLRFRIFTKKNGGVSSARNLGLLNSKGEYVGFVDADDYIYPEYIEKLIYFVQKYDADWAQCSFIKVPVNYNLEKYQNSRIVDYKNSKKYIVFDKENAITDFAYRRHLTGFPYLKLIRSSLAKQISFNTSLKYGEDYIYIYMNY